MKFLYTILLAVFAYTLLSSCLTSVLVQASGEKRYLQKKIQHSDYGVTPDNYITINVKGDVLKHNKVKDYHFTMFLNKDYENRELIINSADFKEGYESVKGLKNDLYDVRHQAVGIHEGMALYFTLKPTADANLYPKNFTVFFEPYKKGQKGLLLLTPFTVVADFFSWAFYMKINED